MSESNRSSGGYGSTAATVTGGIVLIYFGFPALWLWPFWKIYQGASDPPDWMMMMIMPIGWLAEVFPAYRDWVEWGGKALGIG